MRRREKFVITSLLLTIGLWAVQLISLDWRYIAIGVLVLISYFVSAWALAEDLQSYEWLTIIPFPSLYAGSVALFYFLLPESMISRVAILLLFGVGMYALLLTSNIYSVAKGRTIQLLYAANAIGLFYSLLTSVLYTNAIFSLKLPFYLNSLLVGLVHFPLLIMSFWSINLEKRISREILIYSSVLTLVLMEMASLMSFMPMAIWNISLFIMSFLYLSLGVISSFLKGRLFANTIREYSLVGVLIIVLFVFLFPLK